MKSSVQILGCSTGDTTPSVVIQYDTKHPQRYLFNCGEGTQRLCTQHKVKITKLKNVFLTRIHWECMGGLPGMLLTLADVGLADIKIHGGDNLTHALTATRYFLLRTTMSVTTHEFPVDGSSFQDENMTVKAIPFWPETLKTSFAQEEILVPTKREHNETLLDHKKKILSLMFNTTKRGSEHVRESANEKKQSSDGASSGMRSDQSSIFKDASPLSKRMKYEDAVTETHALLESNNESSNYIKKPDKPANERRELYSRRLPKSKPNPISIAYICKGPDYKGKFNPKSAKELGLKPGPLYAQLANGQSVTAPDGTIVHPHQVLGPSRPGAITVIVDVPSVDYIQSLVDAQEFRPYQSGDENFQPRVVIHMVGNGVLEDERYQSWMRSFGNETEHLITGEKYNAQRIMFNSAALSQLKLSKIDSNHFRVPFYSNRPLKPLSDISNLPSKTREAEPKLIYQTEPVAQLDTSQIVSDFDPNQALPTDDALWKEYLKTVEEVKNEIQSTKLDPVHFPGNDVIVTTLGTGSALPSKYRNVSGTLITIPSCGSIILDAGEGTLGSMIRHFGPLGSPGRDGRMSLEECLRGIKCIFISHLHADHHFGVVRILDVWNRLQHGTDAMIYVAAPGRFMKWLDEYSDVQDIGLSRIRFIDNRNLLRRNLSLKSTDSTIQDLLNSLKLQRMESVEVIHCAAAYGVSIEHTQGWKIVYSGDTRPCEDLIFAGKNATLLIHEATFENDLVEDALEKRHSTTEEAVKVGERMNAHSVLLTHFSQRYPKVPIFTDDHGTVGISFDLMEVTIGDLYKLPKYVRALKILYADECEEAKETD